jgi:hypothetical protein
MSGKKSIIGEDKDRIRTQVRLPAGLAEQVSHLCKMVGVPMNAFYSVAVLNQIIAWIPFVRSEKKDIMRHEIRDIARRIDEGN